MFSVQFNDYMFIIHTFTNPSLTESVTFKGSCIKIVLFAETKGRHYARPHDISKNEWQHKHGQYNRWLPDY